MTYYISRRKVGDGNAADISQDICRIHQSASLASRQVNLRGVAGNYRPGSEAYSRQKHLHLFRSCVLSFIQNYK